MATTISPVPRVFLQYSLAPPASGVWSDSSSPELDGLLIVITWLCRLMEWEGMLWFWVLWSHAVHLVHWNTSARNPELPHKGRSPLKPPNYEEGKPHGEATCGRSYLIFEFFQPKHQTREWMSLPTSPASSCQVTPSLCVFLDEAPDIMEQRQTLPPVPCPNSWPTNTRGK